MNKAEITSLMNQFEVQVDDDGNAEMWVGFPIGKFGVGDAEKLVNNLVDVLESGKRGSIHLTKQLDRVEHHKAQLEDALTSVVATYTRMHNKVQRTSPIYKARKDMLEDMPIKALKEYARSYNVPDLDEYILSDPEDKGKLVVTLLDILMEEKNGKENGEGESESEEVLADTTV